jgi:branched-subunit amino acid transport protein
MPWISVLVVLLGAGTLLWLGRWLGRVTATQHRPFVAMQLRYQPVSLLVAIVAVLLVRLLVPDHADYLSAGADQSPTDR